MHWTWNRCLHTGNCCSFSFSWYSPRHTAHLIHSMIYMLGQQQKNTKKKPTDLPLSF
jgi:hypothetical protein